jgi:predicted nucleotidyltransferase
MQGAKRLKIKSFGPLPFPRKSYIDACIKSYSFRKVLPMGLSQNLVKKITKLVLGVTQPDRIILFGSAVSGGMTKDSDIDLLILRSGRFKYLDEYVKVRKALKDIAYPFDILFMDTDKYEKTKKMVGGIAYPAHKTGKVIYEAA